MSIRHSLMRFATKNFVPRRYFFVRYRVSTPGPEIYRIFVPWSKSFGSGKLLYRLCTSGTQIYRIFVPWPKVPAIDVSFPGPLLRNQAVEPSSVEPGRSSVVQQRARRADQHGDDGQPPWCP